MPDRDKVIKAWETVLSRDPLDVAWDLIDDTITLLKGQEPRVLTWDEMMALPHGWEDNACVVLEEKVPVNRWDLGSIWKWTGAAFVQERAEDHRIYNRDSYGKVWRCWNTKPTKEQREGTKWDD